MPVYEYRCAACGGRFDRFLRSSGEESEQASKCPFCGSDEVRKSFSIFGLGGNGGGSAGGAGSDSCGRKSA